MSALKSRLQVITLTSVLLLHLSCGRKSVESRTLPAVREAYFRLDKGDRATAILLLESEVKKNPDNSEARFLLATSYMAECEVDVYSFHDGFSELILSQALEEHFLGNKGGGLGQDPDDRVLKIDDAGTETERHLDFAMRGLVSMKKLLGFLSRLPNVPKIKWPLMDRSIELLHGISMEKDVALYRAIIRAIAIKSFLRTEVLKNESLVKDLDLCFVELNGIAYAMRFTARHFAAIANDFKAVFPDRSHGVQRVARRIESISENVQEIASAVGPLQDKLREIFKCE